MATDLTVPPPLSEYFAVLWRRAWIVIGVTAIVFGIGLGRSLSETRTYRASGQLVLATAGNDNTALQTQMRVIESPTVHDLAVRTAPGIGSVHTQQDGLGSVITVSADSPDAAVAAETVNATIRAYVGFAQQQSNSQFVSASATIRGRVTQLQKQIDGLTTLIQAARQPPGSDLVARRDALIAQQSALQQRLDSLQVDSATGTAISVLARATTPAGPISPNVRDDALIALGAGLLLGLALAFAIEFLGARGSGGSSPPVETSAELLRRATSNVTLMGVLPKGSPWVSEVVSLSAPESAAAESYRTLHDAASFMGLERGRCLEVTSAPDRAGKTETLANLAVVLARSGRRVVVVDCDLRKPRVHEFFGLANETGFTSVMRGAPLADHLQRVREVDHLFALTSGPLPADPVEMLSSDRCREIIGSLLVGGTLVLVDTPPMLPATDAYTLAKRAPVDAIMLVATAETDAREHLRQALEVLHHTGAPQIGVVLTTSDGVPAEEPAGEPVEVVRRWPRRRHDRSGSNGDSETWAGLLGAAGFAISALASSSLGNRKR